MNRTGMRHLYMKQPQSNEPQVRTTTLAIAGMSCDACVGHVTRALDRMTGVVHVNVDLPTAEATVEHLPTRVDPAALIAAVRDAGYEARIVRMVDDSDDTPFGSGEANACSCGCCRARSKTASGR